MDSEYTLSYRQSLVKSIKRVIKGPEVVRFTGHYDSFEAVKGGYDDTVIFDRVCTATENVIKGNACYERDGVNFYIKEYDLQLLSALYEIYFKEHELNILDYGGSLGSTYFQNHDRLDFILNEAEGYTWNIVEQSHYVDYGIENLQDDKLHFFYDYKSAPPYNVVLFASVIQYLDFGDMLLEELFKNGVKYFIIDRVTVSDHERICRQIVREPIYDASYPIKVYDEENFIQKFLDAGYELRFFWMRNPSQSYRVGSKLIKEKSYFFHKII